MTARLYGPLCLLITLTLATPMAHADDSDLFGRACDQNQCLVSGVSRTMVTPGIVHLSAILKVGNGANDRIRIHRIVKLGPGGILPKHGLPGVMLIHPEPLNIDSTFMHGPDAANPATSSISVYLANNDIDVWGYDRRQALVPIGTADLSFMASWDLVMDANDGRLSMLVARVIRGLTGSGTGKMKALGYSRGGQIAYLMAEQETQIGLDAARSINGLIPVDTLMKTDNAALQQAACDLAAAAQSQLAGGIYSGTFGAQVLGAAQAAAADPGGLSPFFPGLTNFQVIVAFGGATYLFGEPYTPYFHLEGANFVTVNNLPIPVSFKYADPNALLGTMLASSPYASQGSIIQGDGVACQNLPIGDQLGAITVPVLYVGAQGGLGDLGFYTLGLLGSSSVTKINISFETSANIVTDFGHDDLLRASSALSLWWGKTVAWIKAH